MRSAGLLVLLLVSGPAYGSGGLSCQADDKSAMFSIDGGVTRGMGGALFSLEGRVEIRSGGIAEDLRVTSFNLEHVAQCWMNGESLNLLLYRERDGDQPHGFVELTIMSRADDEEGIFRGNYELTIYDIDREAGVFKLEGEAFCLTE
jgi:hypothetical protein